MYLRLSAMLAAASARDAPPSASKSHRRKPNVRTYLTPSHRLPRRLALPCSLLTLLLVASALQYLPLWSASDMLSLVSLAESSCTILLVYGAFPSRAPEIVPQRTPGTCCVVLTRRPHVTDLPTDLAMPHTRCESVLLNRRQSVPRILANLPKHDWLFLSTFRTYPCVSTLQNRLVDLDPRGRVFLAQLFSNNSAAPLNRRHVVLSRGTVDRLSSARRNVTFDNIVHAARLAGAMPIHLELAQHDERERQKKKKKQQQLPCRVPSATHALTDIPLEHTSKCIENNPQCAPLVKDIPPLSHLSILVLRDPHDKTSVHIEKSIASIRTLLPRNPILISQPHGIAAYKPIDRYTHIIPTTRDSSARNVLVASAKTTYVLFLRDIHLLAASTRLSHMLSPIHKNLYDIVGGYITPYSNKTLPDSETSSGTGIAIRYSFRSEMALRQEAVPLVHISKGCSRVHRTSDFFMARRDVLLQHAFRPQFGAATHDEFWIRAMRSGLRVATCDTSVRSDASQESTHARSWGVMLSEAKTICAAWDAELGDIGGLVGLTVEYDCEKSKVCGRVSSAVDKWICHAW